MLYSLFISKIPLEFKKNMIKIFNLRTIKFKNRTFVNYEIF